SGVFARTRTCRLSSWSSALRRHSTYATAFIFSAAVTCLMLGASVRCSPAKRLKQPISKVDETQTIPSEDALRRQNNSAGCLGCHHAPMCPRSVFQRHRPIDHRLDQPPIDHPHNLVELTPGARIGAEQSRVAQ